ncbi:MAG: preprotein translocase subunit SecG [Bacilli bacterium]|nr:preprotein translocase subunit SecG [Bacilli bacterium]
MLYNLFLIVAIIIIILVLLQSGKSDGASSAIIGGSGFDTNIFVKTKERGSERVMTILTFIFVILFIVLAILNN